MQDLIHQLQACTLQNDVVLERRSQIYEISPHETFVCVQVSSALAEEFKSIMPFMHWKILKCNLDLSKMHLSPYLEQLICRTFDTRDLKNYEFMRLKTIHVNFAIHTPHARVIEYAFHDIIPSGYHEHIVLSTHAQFEYEDHSYADCMTIYNTSSERIFVDESILMHAKALRLVGLFSCTKQLLQHVMIYAIPLHDAKAHVDYNIWVLPHCIYDTLMIVND